MKPSSARAWRSPRAGGEGAAAGAAGLRARIHVVDDRILLRRIEVRRTEQQAVDVGLAVVRRHLDRHRRLPAGGEQLRDVGLLERQYELLRRHRAAPRQAARRASSRCRSGSGPKATAAPRGCRRPVSATRRGRRRDWSGSSEGSTDPDLARGRSRRTRCVRVVLVDARDLHDRAFAGRDRMLQPAGLQIVEIELAPIVALRVPHDLVGSPTARASRSATRTASPRFPRTRHARRRSRCRPRAARRACGRGTPTRAPAASRRDSSCSRSC